MTGNRTEAHGSKVDLTLESIHGIIGQTNPYNVTAAVYFTGSASNMQVSSFTMCGRTGNLVIESNPIAVATSRTNDASYDDTRKGTSIPLFATFNDPMDGRRSLPSCAGSTTSNSSSLRPHLKLKLSQFNPNAPKRSLQKVNRTNAAILPNPSQLEDVQSLVSCDGSRGASLQWEPEGSPMPEIVELHIVLRDQDHSIHCEGVAHLVFYGSQRELGSTTMDLRIKRKSTATTAAATTTTTTTATSSGESPSRQPCVSFSLDAFVRVHVEVTSEAHPALKPEELVLSDNFDEHKIDNIMTQLKEHEEMAAARAKAHKMNLDKNEDFGKAKPRMFCSGGLDFGDTLRAIVDILTRCEGKRRRRKSARSLFPILRVSSTMDSTIETRESMLL